MSETIARGIWRLEPDVLKPSSWWFDVHGESVEYVSGESVADLARVACQAAGLVAVDRDALQQALFEHTLITQWNAAGDWLAYVCACGLTISTPDEHDRDPFRTWAAHVAPRLTGGQEGQ